MDGCSERGRPRQVLMDEIKEGRKVKEVKRLALGRKKLSPRLRMFSTDLRVEEKSRRFPKCSFRPVSNLHAYVVYKHDNRSQIKR